MLGGPEPAITPPQPRHPKTSHSTPEERNQSVVAQEELGSLRCPQDAQPWDLEGSSPNQVPEGLETSLVPFSLWNSPREQCFPAYIPECCLRNGAWVL